MSRSATMLFLVVLVVQTGCATRPIEAIRDSADFQFNHLEYQMAATGYREIVDRYPGDWLAQYRLGMCELELGYPNRALSALQIAHTNKPTSPVVVDALAEAMFQAGEEQALFELLTGQAQSQQTVYAWLRLGRYAAELGDADTALTGFETAIELDAGRTIEPYVQAALFSQQIGDLDEALRRLRQAYDINPHDPRVDQRLRDLGEIPGPTLALPPGR